MIFNLIQKNIFFQKNKKYNKVKLKDYLEIEFNIIMPKNKLNKKIILEQN